MINYFKFTWDFAGAQWLSGRLLDSRPRDRGSSLTGVTVLCPWVIHIYPCIVLVQPRKTRSDIHTWKNVDWDVKNKIKQTKNVRLCACIVSLNALKIQTKFHMPPNFFVCYLIKCMFCSVIADRKMPTTAVSFMKNQLIIVPGREISVLIVLYLRNKWIRFFGRFMKNQLIIVPAREISVLIAIYVRNKYLHFNCKSLNEPLHLRCGSYLHEQIDFSHTHIRAIWAS